MKPLTARKQMLIAESDLNRTLLINDLTELTKEVSHFSEHSRSLIGIASAAASLLAGLSSYQREQRAQAASDERPWWVKGLFKGAGIMTSLWKTFRHAQAAHHQAADGAAEDDLDAEADAGAADSGGRHGYAAAADKAARKANDKAASGAGRDGAGNAR
jgi:hypothetical protein